MCIQSDIHDEQLQERCKQYIKEIQSGNFDRSKFPDNFIAPMAGRNWNDEKFSYGMEYGAIMACVIIGNLREFDF